MHNRWSLLSGWASLLGGFLTVLVSIPPTWYGLEPPDSYVFDPPTLSPLWINRELMPVLAVVAVIGLLLGIVGLVGRDWSVAGRARRWGGIGGVVAFSGLSITVPVLLYSFRDAGEVLLPFVALAIGALSLLVLVPSLILLAYGYWKTDRPRIGYAFAGLLIAVPVLGYITPWQMQSLVASIPIGVAWGIFGIELLQHVDPLAIPEQETGA